MVDRGFRIRQQFNRNMVYRFRFVRFGFVNTWVLLLIFLSIIPTWSYRSLLTFPLYKNDFFFSTHMLYSLVYIEFSLNNTTEDLMFYNVSVIEPNVYSCILWS